MRITASGVAVLLTLLASETKDGGLLFPRFRPPLTDAWLGWASVQNQHRDTLLSRCNHFGGDRIPTDGRADPWKTVSSAVSPGSTHKRLVIAQRRLYGMSIPPTSMQRIDARDLQQSAICKVLLACVMLPRHKRSFADHISLVECHASCINGRIAALLGKRRDRSASEEKKYEVSELLTNRMLLYNISQIEFSIG